MPEYRSRTTTHGRNMAGARALWRATGMQDGDFDKPIIAVVNSFTQFVPGHVHLKDLGQLVAAMTEKPATLMNLPVGLLGLPNAGKSTLINQILYPALAGKLHNALLETGRHKAIKGLQHLDKVINIDQAPIGRTPRSNPATYTKVFDHIRDLFALLPESKMRGYRKGRFSFNVKGGRCEACHGAGSRHVAWAEMPEMARPQLPNFDLEVQTSDIASRELVEICAWAEQKGLRRLS